MVSVESRTPCSVVMLLCLTSHCGVEVFIPVKLQSEAVIDAVAGWARTRVAMIGSWSLPQSA